MKRKSFLSGFAAVFALPFLSFASTKENTERNDKGFKIGAGEGRKHGHLKLKGVNSNVLDVKISGTDTNGELAIFEQTSLSPGRGTPLHIHPSQDEIFYVMEGTYVFKLGEQKFNLSAGESVFLPRAVPHAWTQVSEKGKMLVTLQPAGKLEDFFVSMAGLDHEPTMDEVAKLFSNNEMKVVGPPMKLD